MVVNSVEFKKKHGIPVRQGLDLKEIAKLSKMPLKALQEVYNKGIGAYKTNPSSVRPQVKSAEQWAYGRVYAFVMKTKKVYYGADDSIRTKYKLK
jgi:hypothetical protein